MSNYNAPHDLKRIIDDIRRRIRELETAPQLSESSIEGGAIIENDIYGNAASQYGAQFDDTHTAASLTGPTPPTPTQPTVTGVIGGINVDWDGDFSLGELTPMDFARVEIHVSNTSGFIMAGSTLKATIETPQGGTQFISLPDTGTYYVCLVTRSQSGKFSPLSLESSATPTVPVVDPVVPATVTGLGSSATWHYDNAWLPALQVTLSWTPVTTDENGNTITVAGYEIWSSTDNTNWTLLRAVDGGTSSYIVTNLSLAATYWFKVRAIYETAGAFSATTSVAGSSVTVTETVPTPTAPVATSKYGSIYTAYIAPGSLAGQVKQAEIGLKTTSGGTYSVIDVVSDPRKNSTVVSKRSEATGTQFWVGVRYVTYGGTSGSWVDSGSNPVALASVVDTDLVNTSIFTSLNSLNNSVTAAQASADGKSKITYGTSAPTAATPGRPGDIFWVRSGDTITGQYLNTAGTGTTSGNTWTAQTLTNTTIATLDAGKITTGTLDALRIGANTITADKVVIGNAINLLPNGQLEAGDKSLWNSSLIYDTTDTPPSLSASLRTAAGQGTLAARPGNARVTGFPVQHGEDYYFDMWVKADVPGSKLSVEVLDENGFTAMEWNAASTGVDAHSPIWPVSQYTVPTTWTRLSAVGTTSASADYVTIGNIFFNQAGGSTTSATIRFGGIRLRKRTDAELIVDGTITGRALAAETIQGYHVAANTITGGNLVAGTIDTDKLSVGAGVGLNFMLNPGFETSGDLRFSPYRDDPTVSGNSINYQPITGATVVVQRISSWSNGATAVAPYAGSYFLETLAQGSTASSYGLQVADVVCTNVGVIGGQSIKITGKVAAYDHSDGTLVPTQQNASKNLDIDYVEVELRVYSAQGSADESIVYTNTKRFYLNSFGASLTALLGWSDLLHTVTVPEEYANSRAEIVIRTGLNSYGRAIAFDDISVTPVASGVLIADGAVSAEKIQAGAVTASKLTGDAIDGKVITGAVMRTSADVGVSNFTTAWTGTANNSPSTISGPGITTRTNIARDPAGKTASIWLQTDGATATQEGNLLGRGGSVKSAAGMLTLPLTNLSSSSLPLAISAQGWALGSGAYNAYVHEAGTSYDGTMFTVTAARPSGVPASNVFDIGKDGRFYWVPTSTASETHKIYSSSKSGTGVTNQTATGYVTKYNNRVLSPVTSAAFIVNNYGAQVGRFNHQIDVSVVRAGAASVGGINANETLAQNGRYVRTNQSLYYVWNEIVETISPGGLVTNDVDFLMTKVTSTGTTPVNGLVFKNYVRDSYFPPVLQGLKAAVDNAIYIKINNTDSTTSFVYYKVTDAGVMTAATATEYNAIADTVYPDDLNGAATTFTYSTEDSQLKGTLVTKTDAQQRYIEANGQAVWTYNKTRAKYSVDLGNSIQNTTGWLKWFGAARVWTAIPNPVVTFRVTTPMSSFLVEHTSEFGFWFSGDTADAGSGAGGIMDSAGLRGYSPAGTLTTNVNFTTGTLTALGAEISGKLEASNAGGSKFIRLLEGTATFASESTTRGTIEATSTGLLVSGSAINIGDTASTVKIAGAPLTYDDVYDTGWVAINISSGFAQQSTRAPEVRRIGRTVHARWGWADTGITAVNTTYNVGTLPSSSFYPSGTVYGLSVGSGSTTSGCRIVISTGGIVQVQTPVSGTIPSYFLFAAGYSWQVN